MKRRSFLRSTLIVLCAIMVVGLMFASLPFLGRIREATQQKKLAGVGLQIPPVYQFDYSEPVCSIGGEEKSVATSGCGATCLSMVIRHLTGDTEQTPQVLFERAYATGDYHGYGLTHEALNRLAEAYGLDCIWIGRDDRLISQALRNGYPIIAHMGPGEFTDEGHYILLRGLTDDGKVVLNDPNSRYRTWDTYSLDEILQQSKTNEPFMICRAAD